MQSTFSYRNKYATFHGSTGAYKDASTAVLARCYPVSKLTASRLRVGIRNRGDSRHGTLGIECPPSPLRAPPPRCLGACGYGNLQVPDDHELPM